MGGTLSRNTDYGENYQADERKGQPQGNNKSEEVFMLVGKLNCGRRERLMVTIRDLKGSKVVDCRVYNILQDGELMATPAGVSFSLDQVEPVMELVREAKKKASEA
jgi:hypothetical protein